MAQPMSSVDYKSDLSVLGADDSVYNLDFVPSVNHHLVGMMIDVFPPISLLQELIMKSAHIDADTFRKAFPDPPCEISEKVKWLQDHTCRAHLVELQQLKFHSGEAIENLKSLYSAFHSSNSDVIIEASEVVQGNASIIFVTTTELFNEVQYRKEQVEQLKDAVSQEMDKLSKLDQLQTQYKKAKKEYEDPYKVCLERLKAFKADFIRHFNYLIKSATGNETENARMKSTGLHEFRKDRRDKKRKLDELRRQIDVLKNELKAIKGEADQGDGTDMHGTALLQLLISLEVMDLHLEHASYLLAQLKIHAMSLAVTCQEFESIALGDEIVSETYWMDFKSDVLGSNVGWVAIDQLFDQFADSVCN